MRIHNYIYMHARMIILIDPLVSCDEISIIYGVILMLREGARVFFYYGRESESLI